MTICLLKFQCALHNMESSGCGPASCVLVENLNIQRNYYLYLLVCTRMYICTCICTYVNKYVCIFVCFYVFMHAYVCIHTGISIKTDVYVL